MSSKRSRLASFTSQIQANPPTRASDLRAMGFRYRRIGFRTYSKCVKHGANEIDAIRRIQTSSRLAVLRKYIPEIIYADRHNGIIVTPRYGLYRRSTITKVISGLAKDLIMAVSPRLKYPRSVFDICARNIGHAKDRPLVFLDLGLLIESDRKATSA